MSHAIASFLFQNKTCCLSGIGTLQVLNGAADADFVNAQMHSPVPSIIFTPFQEGDIVSSELASASQRLYDELCLYTKVTLNGIGELIKIKNEPIVFVPEKANIFYMPSVIAQRVVHQDAEHSILVGDKETTNTVMTELLSESAETIDRWWIGAIVLAIIGIAAITYYLFKNGFNLFASQSIF